MQITHIRYCELFIVKQSLIALIVISIIFNLAGISEGDEQYVSEPKNTTCSRNEILQAAFSDSFHNFISTGSHFKFDVCSWYGEIYEGEDLALHHKINDFLSYYTADVNQIAPLDRISAISCISE